MKKPRKRPARKRVESCAGFLPFLFFDPEDGGDMFLRNVCWLSSGINGEDGTLQKNRRRTRNPKISIQFQYIHSLIILPLDAIHTVM
jgi:hypothetical protein